jgi:predicted nucleotidyltransferase
MDSRQVEVVARRHGIRLLVRFGSSVTGLLHQGSDVDLGVILAHVPEVLVFSRWRVPELATLALAASESLTAGRQYRRNPSRSR